MFMSRSYVSFLLLPFLLLEISFAEVSIDCRVATGGITKCNPYSFKFIKAKEIKYEEDRRKLIVDKILPVPPKASIKVISVVDMLEKYVKVEDSMRFKGMEQSSLEPIVEKETKKQKVYTRIEKLKIQRKALLEKMHKMKDLKQKKRLEKLKLAQDKENLEKQKIIQENKRIEQKKRLEKLKLAQDKENLEKQKIIQENKRIERKKIREKIEKEQLAKKASQEGLYIIEKGDSLSTIAAKFGTKTTILRTLNNLEKTAAIKIGKKLIIPCNQKRVDIIAKAEYIVESGDSFSSIAKDFNLTSSAIVKLNKLKKNSNIKIGQKILLPLPHKLAQNKAKAKKLLAKKEALKKKQAKAKKIKLVIKNRKVKMIRSFGKRKLRVTATAYSSHRGQTDKTPFLAAWNNRIRPGMKIIAVSRDMLTRYGLRNGSKVRIGGLRGYYTVRDKMNKRYRKRIDIYMGVNRRRALQWGRRSVMLYW